MSVVVFGSLNMDLVVRTPRLPLAGETITGHSFFQAAGGKGANQAVAAARLGASTFMVGRVGDDAFGATLLAELNAAGVDTSGVGVAKAEYSGVASIILDDAAQNRIIVLPGANGSVGPTELACLQPMLAQARILLLQLEVAPGAVFAAAKLASQSNVKVILDPAPVPTSELPSELYQLVDIITPNETEAAALVGFSLSEQAAVTQAARILLERGAKNVIIKLGSRGAYWTDGQTAEFKPTFPVTAVDTVAAGDAFNGALATALSENKTLSEAVEWGLAAGALAVTKAGAQPAMPKRADLEKLLKTSF